MCSMTGRRRRSKESKVSSKAWVQSLLSIGTVGILVGVEGFSSVPPLNRASQNRQELHMSDTTEDGPSKPITQSETEIELANQIIREIGDGTRQYPAWYYEQYQEDDLGDEDEDDDPTAIDPETLGKWDPSDLESRLEYEFDPANGDPDPNVLDPKFDYLQTVPVDQDGVEIGYDPIYGPSNPIDGRTILNPQDSYIIDDMTRDDTMVTPTFLEGDLEIPANAKVTDFRRSLNIVQTYTDPFLETEVPRYQARWYGYPEQQRYPDKPVHENRFTKPEDATDFESMTPYRARRTAVELARSKNNEWLPEGTSAAFHNKKTDVFGRLGLKVGSLEKGDIDEQVVERIRPALDVLGSVVDLLETNGTVFRFHYHGLIKNKRGMAAWTETMIRDCGVECTGVVFETGWRKRDPAYDSGDKWFGPY